MPTRSSLIWVFGLLLSFGSGCLESNRQAASEDLPDTVTPAADHIADSGGSTLGEVAADGIRPVDVNAGEVSTDTDIGPEIATRTEGVIEETEGVIEEEVWEDCHYDCFGGLECKEGVMRVGIWAPIPCWVENSSDCFYHGESYPCLSGQCGELELCADDESAIVSLVPAGTTWQHGAVWHTGDVHVGHWSGDADCLLGSCTWLAKNSEQATVVQLTVAAVPQSAVTAVAGTTHMWTAELHPVDVVSLELLGVPVQDIAGVTLYLSQIGVFDGCEAQLRHGASGAAVIRHADATTTTVAWLGGSGSLMQKWVIVSSPAD